MNTLNIPFGPAELRAWQPVPGVIWVQAGTPEHARRLSKRRDGRRVVTGVAGRYLRTFEFHHSTAWARALIARYTASEKTANARKITLAARRSVQPVRP